MSYTINFLDDIIKLEKSKGVILIYNKLAFLSGVFVCIFLFLNGIGASKVGLLTSTFLFHIVAGIIVFLIERTKNGKKKLTFKFPFVYYIPGVLSVIIVAINSFSIKNIGLSLVIGISMFGQLMFSGIVDHYGLLNMPKRRFGKNKFFGISIILFGILIMSI
jgi:transporter family-2 protein